uniref:DUF4159 domain-containing protein n=1 Tax=Paenirhodobacter enshiensis TaxID=1105367 RepID=UPI0035B11335
MLVLGPLGFTAPWLLAALAALPVLWFLLRATPPAPVRRRFPGVVLLLGLDDTDAQAERTPWWLLLLRMLALAAAIVGFAGPVLNPRPSVPATGPLLIVEDGSWASARDWSGRMARIREALNAASAAGRPVALVVLSAPPPAPPAFSDAATLARALPALRPAAWEPAMTDPARLLPGGKFDTLWLSDGLDRPGRGALAAALEARGRLSVWQPARPVAALGRPRIADRGVSVPLILSAPATGRYDVLAEGPDPTGTMRELARATVDLADAKTGEALFDLPAELCNRVTRFTLDGTTSAGAVALADDTLRRRKVALIAGGGAAREGLALLSPLHYLREALSPTADLIGGTLGDALIARPDAIVLADVGTVAERVEVLKWVAQGGVLIRFAGPRLAATDTAGDPLLPVALRQGGRSVGGTMAWGEPRRLAPFPPGSPFAGLAIPQDVTVSEQVMAEPGPDLAAQTVAALADGTPLVTRASLGKGEVVLFHVSANADWSNLPLSGLFPQMLARLVASAGGAVPGAADFAGQSWVPVRLLDGFGRLSATEAHAAVPGADLAKGQPGPDLPPGIYTAGNRSVALDALAKGRDLAPAVWPAGAEIEAGATVRPMPLKGGALALALLLALLDVVAALWVGGKLRGRAVAGLAVAALAAGLAMPVTPARAAETAMPIDRAVAAASDVVLGYIPSGDDQVDRIAEAGLKGLGQMLAERTTVEPGAPMRIDLASDDLALFTLLYWPVTALTPAPTPEEYLRLNRFLRAGGMILFDTRDADLTEAEGAASDAGRQLQAIAAPLEIPPLAQIPSDHVLTRTFYLIQDFPGRYDGPIWVEAPAPDAEQAEGMPFRNLTDGVTPVVIGGNDWASAWAVNDDGSPMFPVGSGSAGERQREVAFRFGINLVMHVLTGNYKSDQVHVPALLERLGQ